MPFDHKTVDGSGVRGALSERERIRMLRSPTLRWGARWPGHVVPSALPEKRDNASRDENRHDSAEQGGDAAPSEDDRLLIDGYPRLPSRHRAAIRDAGGPHANVS